MYACMYACMHVCMYVYLERQWPSILGYSMSILGYFRVRCPVVSGYLAFQVSMMIWYATLRPAGELVCSFEYGPKLA